MVAMKRLLTALLCATSICVLSAQSLLSRRQHVKPLSYNEQIVKKYIDTLQTVIAADTLTQVESVLNNPYVYPMLLNPTFYHFPVKNTMQSNWKPSRIHSSDQLHITMPASSDDSLKTAITRNLMWVYTQTPWLATTSETDISNAAGIRSDITTPPAKETIRITPAEKKIDLGLDDATIKVATHRPNFWTFSGSFSLQFTQAHISDNWYQGGESNLAFLASSNLTANYDNKKKLTFKNNLTMRLGFVEYKNDKKHRYRTNNDQLRLTNELGLKAIKNWSYTLLLQTWTQFYPNYSSNSDYVNSDFLSPLYSNLSIGMSYNLNVKNFSLSATIGALAYNFTYVDRNNLRTRYGVKPPHSSDTDFGSTITIKTNWTIAKNITNTTRIYYYTNYNKVQADCENTTSFTFNKYISTTLFLYPRFDDSHYQNGKSEFFQFKETWSLGLNLSF